jgi:hypothetical protein
MPGSLHPKCSSKQADGDVHIEAGRLVSCNNDSMSLQSTVPNAMALRRGRSSYLEDVDSSAREICDGCQLSS